MTWHIKTKLIKIDCPCGFVLVFLSLTCYFKYGHVQLQSSTYRSIIFMK